MSNLVKLKELLEIKNGSDYRNYDIGDVPVYGSGGVMTYINKALYNGESILLPRKGTLDNIMYVKGRFWTVDTMYWTIVDSSKTYPKYLFCYLSLLDLSCRDSGSTLPSMTLDAYYDLPIVLPEYAIQKKIGDFYFLLTNKIDNNNKIISELKSMTKTIYDYWFLQFDFPDENGKPYKSSGGNMVWNEELKREIPEGWEVRELGSLFNSNRGVSYNSNSIKGNGIPMVNLASFSPDGTYNHKGLKFYSGDYYDEKVLKPFDLVMCNTQQTAIDFAKDIVGRAMLVPDLFDGDIVSSHHVTSIKVYDEYFKYYLLYLFNSNHFHKYVTGFTNGTNIMGLIFDGVEKFKNEIPSERLLKKFAIKKCIHELDNMIKYMYGGDT